MNYKATAMKPFGVIIEPKEKNTDVRSLPTEELRKFFREEHLVLLRGFNTFKNSEDFSDYCESWGEISIWPFGKVLELIEQENPEDHIFDNNYVPLHWDGMYRPQVPEYQIFHCVSAPLAGQGGRTTFSNTISALESASSELKDLWKKTNATYKRKMEFYDSVTESTVIANHPLRGYPVIRYNEPHSQDKGEFINPSDQEFSAIGSDDLEAFHRNLRDTLYSPAHFYAHEWQPGDIVIADNFSLLHGREGFTSKAPRHIQRVQVLSNPPLDNPGLKSYQ
jgi:alpha-ketoglutarate-dependent taurine dioxygenase